MQASVSNFGTARLLDPDSSSNFTANIVGTHGYIAPGEQSSIDFTEKRSVVRVINIVAAPSCIAELV